MTTPLRVLFIEDSKNDCDLLLKHLSDNDYQPTFERVENELGMTAALDKTVFDIVLCDHNLPTFDVFQALSISKIRLPSVPFIVVSGSVREDELITTLQAGAKDYVPKNNLTRLIPAIRRELAEAKTHAAHRLVEAELKQKEMELRQAQKLEAVGQLAGGVAHDFNNILSVILMQAEASLESINEKPEFRQAHEDICNSFEQIKKAGERAANLTRQLLAFSRKQVIQPQILNINELVRDMEQMLRRVIQENITLNFYLDKDCKKIRADRGHFEQIIMNLVVNSRDALSTGGKLTIKTENSFIGEEVAQKTHTKPGPYVLLQVTDTGCGMSEETQRHMFDPFFTTKGVGKGTGLGLSTVYGIVKQNKGLIFVESKIDAGTTFKIYFQQADEGAPGAIEKSQIASAKGKETILIVEDQPEMRKILGETLAKEGYTIFDADDGIEALKILKSSKSPIDLVITDVVMPNMGGRELSEKSKDLKFDSKFLFLSGYTEDVLLQQGINSGQSHFLEKPFALKVLHNKVRNILGRK